MINSNPPLISSNRKTPVRVGLIGVTGYGEAYYDGINRLVEQGRAQWAAVTIINPDQAPKQVAFFEKESVPIYSDYLEMLEKEKDTLDWVCIPTGIGWHTRMAIASLRYGFQVLVEKPLAPTLQDVAAIQAAEQEAGVQVSVGFQYLYQQETWDIKQRLLDGEIGEVLRIDCLSLWPRARSYYERNEWSGHLHDGDSWVLDSPLHNALCHLVNLILFWAGDTLEAAADISKVQAETYRSKPIDSYDTVRTVVEMNTGVEAAVVLSHSSNQRFDPEIHITGTKGKLIWRFLGNYEVVVDGKRTAYQNSPQVKVRNNLFDAVLDQMEGKSARICTTDLAKGTVKWVNTVHDTAPIHDIPQQYRQCIQDESGELYNVVEDLDYYSLRAFKEGLSFKELGAAWAVSPQERDVSNYEGFEGKYCPSPLPPIPDPPISAQST